MIDNGGIKSSPKPKSKKVPFDIPEEQRKNIQLDECPTHLTDLCKRINAVRPCENMKKIQYKHISDWLCQIGALKKVLNDKGEVRKHPTPEGKSLGISIVERNRNNEVYHVVVYSKEAQQFIIDHLSPIIELMK